MNRIWPFFVLLLLVTSCAPITLVNLEEQSLGGSYSVKSSKTWNEIQEGKAVVWTEDGFALNSIRFYAALAAGDELFENEPEKQALPEYDPKMRTGEIIDFIRDSFALRGNTEVKVIKPGPARFGTLDGFQLAFSYAAESGLEYRGWAVGAVDRGKLHLIVYTAPRTHYFSRYLPAVKEIMGSIRLSVQISGINAAMPKRRDRWWGSGSRG